MDTDVKNLVEKIIEWKKKYTYIYSIKVGSELFVFKALTRSEYTGVLEDEKASDMDREEMICEYSTLYPEDYDFTHCLAGIPTLLSEAILTESLLMDDHKLIDKLYKRRDEMYSYENQISCIIIEAFPSLTLDEVESWDMHKTAYYLSRAEWVLSKLRGLPFVSREGEVTEEIPDRNMTQQQPMQQPKQQKQEPKFYKDMSELPKDAISSIKIQNTGKKNKGTKEIDELKRNFPEIDWENDSLIGGGFDFEKDALMTQDVEDIRF